MSRLKNIKIYFNMLFKYNPKTFWDDMLSRSFDLKGVGHFRKSNEENLKMYEEKKKIINGIIAKNNITIGENSKALEIGCGVGYWTEYLKSFNVKDYTGNDIAEISIKNLKRSYPDYKFIHGDISETKLPENTFDIVFMIDVTQHITDDDRFNAAIKNIWDSLKTGGYFFVTMWDPSKNVYLANKIRINKIEKPRGLEWYENIFGKQGTVLENVDFNDKFLLLIRKG
ncbi:MAG: class I SAM-dependent methyltransferase [Ignavibacteria bacterium]